MEATLTTRTAKIWKASLSVVLLLGFFMLTSPSEGNIALTLVPLVLSWVCVFVWLGVLLDVLRVSGARASFVRVVAASCVVLLLMFSALEQLSTTDIVGLTVLVGLATFYIGRTWPQRHSWQRSDEQDKID